MLSSQAGGRDHSFPDGSGRREFLSLLGGGLGLGALLRGGWKGAQWERLLEIAGKEGPPTGSRTLRSIAEARGLLYGAAAPYRYLSADQEFAAAVARECRVLVPGGSLKWNVLRPAPDRFDFSQSDWMEGFAREHGMLLRGHTLVWHRALPTWFQEQIQRRNAERAMLDHIRTVAGRFAGRLHSWDVINEGVRPADRRADGLRETPWLRLLGPEYMGLAFHAAAEADPHALLVYNENRLEFNNRAGETKRRAVLRLLERLRGAGVPVHALGMQAHLFGDHRIGPRQIRRFLDEVAAFDLKVLITELDVTDREFPRDIAERDHRVARAYKEFLAAALDHSAVVGVMTWGLSDRYSWLASQRPRSDGMPVRPLPLDQALQPKSAWYAIADAFDAAPHRIP